MEKKYALLDNINYPSDLKKLKTNQLEELCEDLRNYIIDVMSNHPGHFASGLGVVELTVALHYVFNTPYDQIIFDVGHQAYPHKILSGRKQMFDTLREFHGLCPFPNRNESPYDAFTVGHASTSISAALGLSEAASKLNQQDRNVVAVIGDGSLTGGMAYEALNNLGYLKTNMLVVLNDNEMSIDKNNSALSKYLTDLTSGRAYNKVKNDIWDTLTNMNGFGQKTKKFIQNIEGVVKHIVRKQGNLFEGLGLRYFGPVDGHDVKHLVSLLNDIKNIKGPKILHIKTIKGKGYKFAEENQTKWHATSNPFDIQTGKSINQTPNQYTKYQDVFGITLLELAQINDKIVGITPAMPTGCSMNIMGKEFPSRVYDVGIAEEHAVTFSAGLAAQGLVPFCNIYSSFMQRAYDQIIHDVALPNLPVILCLDRAGIVGQDGATHHGAFDISYLRHIPNLIVSAPMDEIELRNLMFTAQLQNKPFAIRYPRGTGHILDWKKEFEEIPIGKARLINKGEKIAILSIGTIGYNVKLALEKLKETHPEINPTFWDMRFCHPLDTDVLHDVFKNYDRIITTEENSLSGGFGSAVLEFMADNNYSKPVKRIGLPDKFIEHGSTKELFKVCKISWEDIYNAIIEN